VEVKSHLELCCGLFWKSAKGASFFTSCEGGRVEGALVHDMV